MNETAQGAIPQLIANTKKSFFNRTIVVLREAADLCFDKLKEIECITCPHKPEGSMFVMVKLDVSCFEDIKDDIDFCSKLAKEESVIMLPGTAGGKPGWLRITFAIEPATLEDGLGRAKSFCQRHSKQ